MMAAYLILTAATSSKVFALDTEVVAKLRVRGNYPYEIPIRMQFGMSVYARNDSFSR